VVRFKGVLAPTASYTNNKEMAGSLEEAKRPETRRRRLAAAIEKLR
jgi:hypothetical protein